MGKEDVLKEAKRVGLNGIELDLGGSLCLYFEGKRPHPNEDDNSYLRLMFYKDKWYGCLNDKVPKGSVDWNWIRNALKSIA